MKLAGHATLEKTIRCRLAGWATLRGSTEVLARLRKEPIVVGGESLSASFLRHADDQTVLALRTVLEAIEKEAWQQRSFRDWGVVAAANFFGRTSIAQTVQRLAQEGAWGVSPHVIPHQSLHAMSGTISQALHVHGPNFGINGGPNAAPDAFLISAAMMMDRRLPGLWVVLTGYESENIPPLPGTSSEAPSCQAVALALTPTAPNERGMYLSLGCLPHDVAQDFELAYLPEFHLALLAEELAVRPEMPTAKWRLSDSHWLEIESSLVDAEGRR